MVFSYLKIKKNNVKSGSMEVKGNRNIKRRKCNQNIKSEVIVSLSAAWLSRIAFALKLAATSILL